MQWRNWLRVLQIVVTITLIGVLLREVHWSDMKLVVVNLQWQYVAASIVLVLVSHLVNVVRWQYLVHSSSPRYHTLLEMYGAGLFYNNFLPTGIGGDGVRAALLSKYVSVPQAVFSVALDRGIAILAFSALVVIGVWIGIPALDLQMHEFLVSFASWRAVSIGFLIISGTGVLSYICWKRFPKLRSAIVNTSSHFLGLNNSPEWTIHLWLRLLAGGYSLSVLSHLSLVATHWSVMQALGIDVTTGAAVWLVLIGSASLLLPVSVNGLGLQESIYVLLLSSYGVSTVLAMGVALLIRMLMLLFSLAGGLLSLRTGTVVALKSVTKRSGV